ncbi:MAG: hypothetical protein AVDCRST_MAG19-1753, partial [uncultured Thermomicrobiales bacterium]
AVGGRQTKGGGRRNATRRGPRRAGGRRAGPDPGGSVGSIL